MRYYDLAKSRPARGSNKYEKRYVVRVRNKKQGQWKLWLAGYGIFIASIFLTRAIFTTYIHQAHAQIVSPLPTPIQTFVTITTPTPTATPTPYYTPQTDQNVPTYHYDASEAIKRIWGKDAYIGLAIASCESGIDPDKYNINTDGSIDFSVFQVNTVHGIMLDPEENIRYAYQLFSQQGTTPWDSSKHCWAEKL